MGGVKMRSFGWFEAVEFLNKKMDEKPLVLLMVPLLLVLWAFEKWLFSLYTWLALALAVWATIQYGSYQRRILEEDLNKKWVQLTLQTSPVTPLQQCEWLNKLLTDVWSNYIHPKLSSRFSSIIERRLKHRKSRLFEKIELQEFSLGSCPPVFGLNGIRWATSGDQRVMHLGFNWDTSDVNILLSAKLAKPLKGTARIIVNSIHIKGDLLLVPILEGKAIVYSFVSTPDVRIGVAFGSGVSQSLPATELPGVSLWLVVRTNNYFYGLTIHLYFIREYVPRINKRGVHMDVGRVLSKGFMNNHKKPTQSSIMEIVQQDYELVSYWLWYHIKTATDTLNKRMVEPRRQCLALAAVDLQKKAVGGVLYVTVVSASKLSRSNWRSNLSTKQTSSSMDTYVEDRSNKELQTFIEIELEELTRKTDTRAGSNPLWGSTFNLILHDNAGVIKFNLYECTPGSVKYDYLTSCEVKMRYVPDDSTIFWAIGSDSSVIAKQAEFCGKEIQMTVPFEGGKIGELTVKMVLKEWQFSDGSHSLSILSSSTHHPPYRTPNYFYKTGKKIYITVVEGKDLVVKDKIGKSEPYVKLQYGKATQRTRTVSHTSNPIWNQKFEFDELVGGEYLKIKCYTEETFSDESIGSARVNLEGLIEGCTRDVCIPLEKVKSGELQLQIEAVKVDGDENSKGSHATLANGLIELVLIQGRDLVAADLRGTSDPYVRVHYGNMKGRTKVMYKTLNPKWHQTFEFPDDGSPLVLHVKDHNTLLPRSSIGDCVVEYQMLSPNQMAEKWIPLQGVKRGEIHVQIIRKLPELEKKSSVDSELSPTKLHRQISKQMKQMMIKIQSLIDDNNLEAVSKSLSELETLYDTQEEYMVQLESEQMTLIGKVEQLGIEIFNSSPSLRRATLP